MRGPETNCTCEPSRVPGDYIRHLREGVASRGKVIALVQRGKHPGAYRLSSREVINPRRACAARVTVVGLSVCLPVCLSVCLSVSQHLTSGASVRLENAVTYSTGDEGQKICGVFSETAPLQRSSTPSVVRLMRSRPFLSLRKMRMRMSSPSISGALAHADTLQPLRRGFAL